MLLVRGRKAGSGIGLMKKEGKSRRKTIPFGDVVAEREEH